MGAGAATGAGAVVGIGEGPGAGMSGGCGDRAAMGSGCMGCNGGAPRAGPITEPGGTAGKPLAGPVSFTTRCTTAGSTTFIMSIA